MQELCNPLPARHPHSPAGNGERGAMGAHHAGDHTRGELPLHGLRYRQTPLALESGWRFGHHSSWWSGKASPFLGPSVPSGVPPHRLDQFLAGLAWGHCFNITWYTGASEGWDSREHFMLESRFHKGLRRRGKAPDASLAGAGAVQVEGEWSCSGHPKGSQQRSRSIECGPEDRLGDPRWATWPAATAPTDEAG
jgi:hypothetical protein